MKMIGPLNNILRNSAPIFRLHKPNLLFINQGEIEGLKEKGEIKIFEINKSKKVFDKRSLLEELYIKGEFGDHFGFNWDALNDCLTEYDTGVLVAIIFIFYYYSDMNKGDFDIFLKTFSDASKRYKEGGVALKLILVD